MTKMDDAQAATRALFSTVVQTGARVGEIANPELLPVRAVEYAAGCGVATAVYAIHAVARQTGRIELVRGVGIQLVAAA